MATKIYLTGFAQFAGVDVNPSASLVDHLACDPGSGVCLLGSKVLRVAAEGVRQWLHAELYPQLAVAGGPIIVVHLGVDVKGHCIKLERQAVNDASFRVPDEDGYQPSQAHIGDLYPLGYAHATELPLEELKEHLDSDKVVVSDDAGRYVCNFTYFVSLMECVRLQESGREVHALFVHVPPFDEMAESEQLPFIDEDQPIRKLFPDSYYAIVIPVYAGVLLFSATLVTLGGLLLWDELRRNPKAA